LPKELLELAEKRSKICPSWNHPRSVHREGQ